MQKFAAILFFLFSFLIAVPAQSSGPKQSKQKVTQVKSYSGNGLSKLLAGGGSEKKERKKRMKAASKKARGSAKNARRATRQKQQEIMMRAKIRNFFNRTFNAKYGKTRNFRSKRVQRRYSKGK